MSFDKLRLEVDKAFRARHPYFSGTPYDMASSMCQILPTHRSLQRKLRKLLGGRELGLVLREDYHGLAIEVCESDVRLDPGKLGRASLEGSLERIEMVTGYHEWLRGAKYPYFRYRPASEVAEIRRMGEIFSRFVVAAFEALAEEVKMHATLSWQLGALRLVEPASPDGIHSVEVRYD